VLAGASQFGIPEQGIFSYWVRAYALRRPLRYLGFDGSGCQVRDALHPHDLADLIWKQMHATFDKPTVWNVGGGAGNATSLALLSAWCRAQFGPHEVQPDPRPRPFDVPWIVMDSGRASAHFSWTPRIPLDDILQEIAGHHRQHPDWLDLSEVL
jgi:CDP-paratose 2-epimerase